MVLNINSEKDILDYTKNKFKSISKFKLYSSVNKIDKNLFSSEIPIFEKDVNSNVEINNNEIEIESVLGLTEANDIEITKIGFSKDNGQILNIISLPINVEKSNVMEITIISTQKIEVLNG